MPWLGASYVRAHGPSPPPACETPSIGATCSHEVTESKGREGRYWGKVPRVALTWIGSGKNWGGGYEMLSKGWERSEGVEKWGRGVGRSGDL
jgi:hypothetical protein